MRLIDHTFSFTCLSLALAGATGCGGPAFGSDEGHATEVPRELTGHTPLQIPLEQSPSGGAEFDFCTNVPVGDFDLNQAAWLTFFAANEYAHFGYIAPMLEALGFGNPDPPDDPFVEGHLDDLWRDCAIDLDLVRAHEADHAADVAQAHAKGTRALEKYVLAQLSDESNGWGVCAEKWFYESGYDGSIYPAASFEKWLIQTEHPGSYIQFFSGGQVDGGNFFTEGSTQVQLMRHGSQPLAIISFRGTEPDKWLDVATDAIALQTALEGWGEAHRGFVNGFRSVEPFLDNILDELQADGVEIYVTGHSLGGALATMMTQHILQRIHEGDDLRLRATYTVGSPRVGDSDFQAKLDELADLYGVNVMRIRNDDDIVTGIPFIQDWQHVGQLVFLTEDDLELLDESPGYVNGIGSVSDHDVTNGYYRRLMSHMVDPRFDDLHHCP